MNSVTILLLIISTACSVGRNLCSKNMAKAKFPSKSFFLAQSILFAGACIFVLLFSKITTPSPMTFLYAAIYGVCVISAQWFYTLALQTGATSVCASVYSLNFIFPTLSGALVWHETLSITKIIGIVLVLPALFLSAKPEKGKKINALPLFIAMFSAGGLGIMQKVQQSSAYTSETGVYMLMALGFASLVSFFASLITKKGEDEVNPNYLSLVCGICYGGANLLNTLLAGRGESALIFPIINVSAIIATLIASLIVLKEKLTQRDVGILIFSIASILVLNL